MSVTAVPLRPIAKGSVLKLWIGLAILILAAAGVAWAGTAGQQWVTSASGVRLQVIEEGEGPNATATDMVLVDYEGRLEDGTVFDSTQGRGPATFPVGAVVPGFAEGLQMMKKGGTYRLWIPSELAYGANVPPGGPIPPNANLDFTVKVLDMAPQSALQGMMPPHGGGM